jgi:hypothetical protein
MDMPESLGGSQCLFLRKQPHPISQQWQRPEIRLDDMVRRIMMPYYRLGQLCAASKYSVSQTTGSMLSPRDGSKYLP